MNATSIHSAAPGPAAQVSTRIVFFIAGFGLSAWAPLVPYAQARTGLGDGPLGLLLLCLGAGSIVTMPLAGALAARFGCRRVLAAATALVCATLPLLATLSHPGLLAVALFVFGAGVGALDCTVNIQAIVVERASGRAMMSGFHGLFSVGGIAGAGGVSLLLMLGASPIAASLAVVAIMAIAIARAAPNLLSGGVAAGGPSFALPRGVVLFIGVLCFIVFLTEGAALDWSGIFLTAFRRVDPAYAGFAYAAFAATMTIGRLAGDAVVRRVGAARIVGLGAAIAAAGLALATLGPSWIASLVGYALVGAGCSNIVPVLYTAVGRQRSMPEHLAVPAITTLGYSGILAGPATIGFIAQAAGLPTALLIDAVLLVGVAASARWLRR
jgi:predicted MFS family arabinose efflux permease